MGIKDIQMHGFNSLIQKNMDQRKSFLPTRYAAWLLCLLFFSFIVSTNSYSADFTGDIARVNGLRFVVIVINESEIFIPSDNLLSRSENLERAFCRTHLQGDDYIKIRGTSLSLDDNELLALTKICKDGKAKARVPKKPENEQITEKYNPATFETLESIRSLILQKR